MKMRRFSWFIIFVLGVLVLVSINSAIAAANIVQDTHLANWSTPITFGDLYPACAGMNPMPTIVMICKNDGKLCAGTKLNELLIGNLNTPKLDGGGGNDCCIRAAGSSTIFTPKCEYHN